MDSTICLRTTYLLHNIAKKNLTLVSIKNCDKIWPTGCYSMILKTKNVADNYLLCILYEIIIYYNCIVIITVYSVWN